jgi:hypothetical protein
VYTLGSGSETENMSVKHYFAAGSLLLFETSRSEKGHVSTYIKPQTKNSK